ncbi:MAG: DNA polymerase III subunit alpha [bacterium]
MNDFVHLHVHTEYSLLDGAGKIKDLVAKAKADGMKALAITDHGVMYGAINFYQEAVKQGIKPIIGCEVYVAPRSRFEKTPKIDDKYYHLILLAENLTGYKNLLKIVTAGWTEGFYYKPRVDKEILARYSEGIIALSGCIGGETAQKVLSGQLNEARRVIEEYQHIFGPDNFFIEIQDQGLPEEKGLNQQLAKLGRELNIPLAATNDTHYVAKGDARTHDILLCIQTAALVDDENRMRFTGEEFYLKSPAEMAERFRPYPEALSNTLKIAERCTVDLSFKGFHLPHYEVPAGETLESYLRKLCLQGLKERYGSLEEKLLNRLNYELDVINNMGYPAYFLIVWDFIHFAKKQGIYVGPGRGSAAGSLVAYSLGITDLDPLQYDLLFERFLNPERISMPDIDVDFCYQRRDEVIQYVIEKYGKDHVAQITTFGTMAARAAIRDVGRALNLPLPEVDKIAKLIPGELDITINKALEQVAELREMYNSREDIKLLLDTARDLEGLSRHASIHAAGVVISRDPLTEYVPLTKTSDGTVSTQYTMLNLEKIGLLKMDFLGLRTLTVLGECVKLVAEKHQKKIDLLQIPLDDAEVYAMLGRGDTCGVFQLESSGVTAIIQQLKPERLDDIIALLALYRPGPLGSGMAEDFVKRKHGEVEIEYPHPLLEPILKETYGIFLYQEQIMRCTQELAGFTLGQADLLRRAMGKKDPETMAKQKSGFVEGAKERGVDKGTAEKIFDLMAHFAGYGFNKSHSAAYGLITYQTAYLKHYYPAEYMAAFLTSIMDNHDKVSFYLEAARKMGLEILPPDINASALDFTVEAGKIRFALAAIKSVGRSAIESFLKEKRKNGLFTSFLDFCERLEPKLVNRKVIESLIQVGVFDSLGHNRATLLLNMERCLDWSSWKQKERASGQCSLFDLGGKKEEIPLTVVEEKSQRELLLKEKEFLGFYISGHPLSELKLLWERRTKQRISELGEYNNQRVYIGGLIIGLRQMITKRGENMAFILLEDLTAAQEVIVFPKVYLKCRAVLAEDRAVLVQGRVQADDELKVIAEQIVPLEEVRVDGSHFSEEQQEALQKLILKYKGDTPLIIKPPGEKRFMHSGKHVSASAEFFRELDAIQEKKGS